MISESLTEFNNPTRDDYWDGVVDVCQHWSWQTVACRLFGTEPDCLGQRCLIVNGPLGTSNFSESESKYIIYNKKLFSEPQCVENVLTRQY